MSNSTIPPDVPSAGGFLWVNLGREIPTALASKLPGSFAICQVTDPQQIPHAIDLHTPPFLCFEFDEPNMPGIAALSRTRREHPNLPILMITARLSEALAIWALRIRIWDVLLKPITIDELGQRIATLIELTRRPRPALSPLSPKQCPEALARMQGSDNRARTYPAIAEVAAHFDHKTGLDHVAALCRLSPSQFCRVFRQEHGVSFAQYLLRYRIDRACERLAHPGARAKDVAYSVGFNDLSYFTRAFKRQVGVCPSQFQSSARSSQRLAGLS